MGKRDLLQTVMEKLGQRFRPAAAPVTPVTEDLWAFLSPEAKHDDVLHGMHNLEELKAVISGLVSFGADNGEQVFQIEGSDHNSMYQDIVIIAPDTSKFVLRLDVFPHIDKHKIETEIVIGAEVFLGDDEKFIYDPTSNPQVEFLMISKLIVWGIKKCPQERFADFYSLLNEFVEIKYTEDTSFSGDICSLQKDCAPS